MRNILVVRDFSDVRDFFSAKWESRPTVAELPGYQIRPNSPKSGKTSGFRILGRLPKLQNSNKYIIAVNSYPTNLESWS